MAMAPQTSARRAALTDLNVNAAIGKGSWTDSRAKASSPEKPAKVAEALLPTFSSKSEMPNTVCQEAELVVAKRRASLEQDTGRASKRFRSEEFEGEAGSEGCFSMAEKVSDVSQGQVDGILPASDMSCRSPRVCLLAPFLFLDFELMAVE